MPALSSQYTVEDQQRMTPAKNYFAWQSRLVTRELGTRVLEVGCGIGNFTKQLLDRESVIAVDLDEACVDVLRSRFRDRRNVYAAVCDVCSDEFRALARFRPDSCVALNVLEHVEDDRGALERIASVVGSGGAIILMVPAFEALYGPIDRNLGHRRRYSAKSLRATAEAAGLELKKLRFVNSVGFFGWWINARVLRLQKQSAGQIGIFDRWIVPAMSRIEDRVKLPFGQSLLAVLQVP